MQRRAANLCPVTENQTNAMKRTILLAVFTFLLPVFGFFSCELNGNCDGSPTHFDINGMELRNSIASRTPVAGGFNRRPAEEGETVAFTDHFVSVNFSVTYHARREAVPHPYGAAYALSCLDPVSRERLDTLYVITRNAWDNTRPAGDTINDIVEANGYVLRYDDLERFSSLTEYFGKDRKSIPDRDFAFRINREPEFKGTDHAFLVVFKLQNGEVYTAETNNIKFK